MNMESYGASCVGFNAKQRFSYKEESFRAATQSLTLTCSTKQLYTQLKKKSQIEHLRLKLERDPTIRTRSRPRVSNMQLTEPFLLVAESLVGYQKSGTPCRIQGLSTQWTWPSAASSKTHGSTRPQTHGSGPGAPCGLDLAQGKFDTPGIDKCKNCINITRYQHKMVGFPPPPPSPMPWIALTLRY